MVLEEGRVWEVKMVCSPVKVVLVKIISALVVVMICIASALVGPPHSILAVAIVDLALL